jgi:hypothetical protein
MRTLETELGKHETIREKNPEMGNKTSPSGVPSTEWLEGPVVVISHSNGEQQ